MSQKNGGFIDAIFSGLGDALTDIREKVVEEPWFGKAVTEQESPEWPKAREAEAIQPEPDREREAADRDMER
jgi:hypothetical protein